MKNHENVKASRETPGLPVYDSQAQAAAATGIPAGAFRIAKRGGCSAFRSNRIHLREFLAWWFAREADDLATDWSRELKKAQAIRERLRARREERELVDLREVEELVTGWLLPVREALIAVPDEMAARCNPADPEHARVQLDEWMRRTMRVMAGTERAAEEDSR